jgi:hypothetical protein
MARLELDREDLMREATALVRRIEIQLPDERDATVVGVRRGGDVSIYVSADFIFQFNREGKLRRGFWNGRLLKAEDGRLIQLERVRTAAEVQLVRHVLSDAESSQYLQLADNRVNQIFQEVNAKRLAIVKQVPCDFNANTELATWLNSLARPITIAAVPNVSPRTDVKN